MKKETKSNSDNINHTRVYKRREQFLQECSPCRAQQRLSPPSTLPDQRGLLPLLPPAHAPRYKSNSVLAMPLLATDKVNPLLARSRTPDVSNLPICFSVKLFLPVHTLVMTQRPVTGFAFILTTGDNLKVLNISFFLLFCFVLLCHFSSPFYLEYDLSNIR